MTKIHVVELTDESDDLIGYGICLITPSQDGLITSYEMLPEVWGTRSQAHGAAADRARRDGGVVA